MQCNVNRHTVWHWYSNRTHLG